MLIRIKIDIIIHGSKSLTLQIQDARPCEIYEKIVLFI